MIQRRRLRILPEAAGAWLTWCIVPLLPRRAVVALSRGLGALAWRFSRRDRRISEANLALVLGETHAPVEWLAIGKASFQQVALTLLDLFWFSRWTESRYRRYVQVDARFRSVLGEVPLVGVTGHIGNWEILRAACGMEGVPMTAVAMPVKNPIVDRMLGQLRQRTGADAVPRAGAVRSLLRCLREGRITGLVLDQNTLPSEGGVFVPFFGLPVPVSNVAGLLGVKTGAKLLVGAAMADSHGVYRVVLKDPVSPEGKTPEALTAEVTGLLEELVRDYPQHWLWSYKRWRYYRPDDPVERYPYYASAKPSQLR